LVLSKFVDYDGKIVLHFLEVISFDLDHSEAFGGDYALS
jgi:hypothetical protein